MSRAKTVWPSESYSIAIPVEATEDHDDRVSSFWVPDEARLLQLSSYERDDGQQVDAKTRLIERMSRHPARWRQWTERLNPDTSIDEATAECLDENGVLWIHTYLVWSDLAIYALVSGPEKDLQDRRNWAFTALKSIERPTTRPEIA